MVTPADGSKEVIQEEINQLKQRLALLESQLKEKEKNDTQTQKENTAQNESDSTTPTTLKESPTNKLTPDQISRYSRQLLLSDGFGTTGQQTLLQSSILVIGAGGIGSTLLYYLASSGIGHITVVDFDTVEMSNLHRQIIHTQGRVGMNKALSACLSMQALNPTIKITPVMEPLTHENALELVERHDLVVDACDNPRTRYILNDACVLANKVLVSGSAMGTEGQLTVYDCRYVNDNEEEGGKRMGACYRCLYPRINASEGCKSCSDNGVLGPVPGLIGVLQSVEVMKILTGVGTSMDKRLIMYDSLNCSFLGLKKTPPNPKCAVCSPNATIQSMQDSQKINAIARGPNIAPSPVDDDDDTKKESSKMTVTNLDPNLEISCADYHQKIQQNNVPHVLLDVRVKRQYDMCALRNSINIPLGEIKDKLGDIEKMCEGNKPIYCLCRRGIASAEATRILQEVINKTAAAAASSNKKEDELNRGDCKEEKAGEEGMINENMTTYPGIVSVCNISGGLNAWVEEVDPNFPKY